ncbi:MAG TPA: ABC-type transport auxiliary lipoprotein family protein [Gemmatimonadaceae bacterium]|nr:ABC-type transport auxiliary lipoprotein family protein [Gemmatimonadaceae bacterium]
MNSTPPLRGPRRRTGLLWALAVLWPLGGCFHGQLPARELYRLRLPVAPDSVEPATADGSARVLPAGGIAVGPYEAPGLYGDRSIVYRIGDTEYGSYPNREWALPLSTMLGMITEDVLRAHPVTADLAVFDPPSPHAYTYLWRGRVLELEEVDRGSQVFAAVRLDARLVRSSDDSVLWSGTRHFERAVPQGSMPAIVETLSTLVTQAVTELAAAARTALAESAASAARGSP